MHDDRTQRRPAASRTNERMAGRPADIIRTLVLLWHCPPAIAVLMLVTAAWLMRHGVLAGLAMIAAFALVWVTLAVVVGAIPLSDRDRVLPDRSGSCALAALVMMLFVPPDTAGGLDSLARSLAQGLFLACLLMPRARISEAGDQE